MGGVGISVSGLSNRDGPPQGGPDRTKVKEGGIHPELPASPLGWAIASPPALRAGRAPLAPLALRPQAQTQ